MKEGDYIKFKPDYISELPSYFISNTKTISNINTNESKNNTNTKTISNINTNESKNNTKTKKFDPIAILNKQIMNLYSKISPTEEDLKNRLTATKDLSDKLQTFFKHKIQLNIFGSVAINNYLPSSDIDISLKIEDLEFITKIQIDLLLEKIKIKLLKNNISCVFISAKVSILKILFKNYKFDLSVCYSTENNNHSEIILAAYNQFKGLKQLHYLVNLYLHNRNITLNNIAVFVLCHNFLHFYPINCDIKENISVILMDFFYYFGVVLNKKDFAIKFTLDSYKKADQMSVEDFLNGNDISINFVFIQQSFWTSFRLMELAIKEFRELEGKAGMEVDFISLWFRDDFD
ncbi:Poly(A) RNA polymerase protein 1 [Cucumispora dikerogammari]|nr:Poly(A) RNA polymerase protein 1 [Cucumispora dikerogammari]